MLARFTETMAGRISRFILAIGISTMMLLHPPGTTAADIIPEDGRIEAGSWKNDPETVVLESNWQALKERQLRLLPVPKSIAFEDAPVVLSGEGEQEIVIVVDKKTDRGDIAVNEIQSRMNDFSGHLKKRFPVSRKRAPGAYNIVIENHWPNTFTKDQAVNSQASTTEQSYGIYPEAEGIVLAGLGEVGMMYAAVTLRYLITEKDSKVVLYPARVRDWPDYKNRQLGQFLSPYHLRFVSKSNSVKHLEHMKNYIDWMFRMKGNGVFHHTIASKVFSSKPDMLPVSGSEMEMARAVSEYARVRSIRTMHHGSVRLGKVGKDDKRAGFNEMMVARGGKDYYSWARHDLHRNKAANMSEFLLRSGFDMAFIHAVDGGGIRDPELWSKRDPLTRKMYGNDRVQADADMFNIYVKEFRKRDKELVLVAYPYTAGYLDPEVVMRTLRLGHGQSAEKQAENAIAGLTDWMKQINEKIDESVRMCVREDNRERLGKYYAIYQDRPMWIYWETAHYTKSIRPLIASTVRSIGSGYFPDRPAEDMIWINTLDYQGFDEQIQVTGAEFSWNTKFPGWSDYDPAYRVSGGVEVDDQDALNILSERAAVGLWGDEAGQYMKDVFNGHLSWKVAIDPYEATKKLDRKVVPGLVKRNQQAVDRAVQAMDALWNHYAEQKKRGRKVFDDFSWPYFIQYWGMTKAAKAYSDMHAAISDIRDLERVGKRDDARAVRELALQQARENEAEYRSTMKLIDGEPWVYRRKIGRHKHPLPELIDPDFADIRQKLENIQMTRPEYPLPDILRQQVRPVA